MSQRRLVLLVLAWGLALGCARVPPQSVALSATVGRDIAAVHGSHRQLVAVLFSRLRRDVSRFVDEVYAPAQLRTVMARQGELAASGNAQDRKKSLLPALDAAFKPGASAELQAEVLGAMAGLLQAIRADVEVMRQELLRPLEAQEQEVLSALDGAYGQIHYANSIVTGHLASVVEVHDTQDELLARAGAPNLRVEVGGVLSRASTQIGGLVARSSAGGPSLDPERSLADLRAAIGELGTRLAPAAHPSTPEQTP